MVMVVVVVVLSERGRRIQDEGKQRVKRGTLGFASGNERETERGRGLGRAVENLPTVLQPPPQLCRQIAFALF
ncbi:hypothetical protein M0802_015897 [Mischocyttarus mexicanus]|nr:hypothetical protein M0802_016631 [Mischocyttarus mexicanus]KAI4473875.1 hypothetical protein M0802_015900 [Mischocyttarus mexicanus]KAI4473880.1 hypothetical protein M0802_015897 [Mischocyttarus mexicanus]